MLNKSKLDVNSHTIDDKSEESGGFAEPLLLKGTSAAASVKEKQASGVNGGGYYRFKDDPIYIKYKQSVDSASCSQSLTSQKKPQDGRKTNRLTASDM